MPEAEVTIAQKRQRMHHIEAEYLRTREYLKSPEWAIRRDMILMRLSNTLGRYRYGQDSTAAVFILGQAKQVMLEIQEVTDVISEYEDLRNKIREYDERSG